MHADGSGTLRLAVAAEGIDGPVGGMPVQMLTGWRRGRAGGTQRGPQRPDLCGSPLKVRRCDPAEKSWMTAKRSLFLRA